ncbi:MAG: pantetheine-phosphate adenylyltransferase [Caldisericia bacterium]|nr:pantetheine-phosphate adenylyltransferase [Caldisericia bacterium]
MAEQSSISGHALYPGTFDPPTLGHVSIIRRAAKLFNKLTIGVANLSEKNPMLNLEQRIGLMKEIFKDHPNVDVKPFSGLLVDFARSENARIIVRGMRNITDFDYEYRMDVTNRHCLPDLETIFLLSDPETGYISSTLVKQIAKAGGDISDFVPEQVIAVLKGVK